MEIFGYQRQLVSISSITMSIEWRNGHEAVGEEAFQAILSLLSGKQAKNEVLGYHSSIDIYTMGPVI